jgi:hypothetical protein
VSLFRRTDPFDEDECDENDFGNPYDKYIEGPYDGYMSEEDSCNGHLEEDYAFDDDCYSDDERVSDQTVSEGLDEGDIVWKVIIIFIKYVDFVNILI